MTTRIIRPTRYSEMSSMTMDDKFYPKFTIGLDDFPEAGDWKVGETYEVVLTVKQIAKNQDKSGGSATFEIRKIETDDEEEAEEGEDAESESEE